MELVVKLLTEFCPLVGVLDRRTLVVVADEVGGGADVRSVLQCIPGSWEVTLHFVDEERELGGFVFDPRVPVVAEVPQVFLASVECPLTESPTFGIPEALLRVRIELFGIDFGERAGGGEVTLHTACFTV